MGKGGGCKMGEEVEGEGVVRIGGGVSLERGKGRKVEKGRV